MSHLVIQGKRVLDVALEIVNATQFQRRNRIQQSSELLSSISPDLKFVSQANFVRAILHQQANPKIFDPATEIDAQHAQRYSHSCIASPVRPAPSDLFLDTRWQQQQAEDIDSAQTKTAGNALQVASRRLFRQQIAKRAASAVGCINRSIEAEMRHLSLECLGVQSTTRKPPAKVAQRRPADIEASHLVTSCGQPGD
jgi:hypothetical protein